MDSEQNQNQDLSSEPEQNTGYEQYIDPNHASKKRRNIIIIAVSSLLLLILIVTVALAIISSDNDENLNGTNTNTTAQVCSDEACFADSFYRCLPAEFVKQVNDDKIKYSITGEQDVGCSVSFNYVESEDPEILGKEKTCDLDNELEFSKAEELAGTFPDDYQCRGSLIDTLKELENAPLAEEG